MRADPNYDDFIIDLGQDWQCRWWSKELGVAPELLKAAIRDAGPLARNVRYHLQAMQVSATRDRSSPKRRKPL